MPKNITKNKKGFFLLPHDVLAIIIAIVSLIFAYSYFVYIKDYSQNSEEFNEEKYHLYALTVSQKMKTIQLQDDFKSEISDLCNGVEVHTLQDLSYLKYTCEEFEHLFEFSELDPEDPSSWRQTEIEREIQESIEELFVGDDYFAIYKRVLNEKNGNSCIDFFGAISESNYIDIYGSRGFFTLDSASTIQIERGNALIVVPSKGDPSIFGACKKLEVNRG